VQGTAQETMERMNANNTGGHKLPGWEPERLVHLQELLEAYAPLGAEGLAENFKYFIQAIMPTCEQYDVKMAMHPDDPPKALFGLPRIATDAQDLRRIESFYDSPYNGFTLCTGSLGENRANDVPALIREFAGRDKVPFAQIRNIKFTSDVDFHESAHPSAYGSLDMYEIMLAFYQAGFDGYARSDHGRDIWGERGRPGYGLYDRALGFGLKPPYDLPARFLERKDKVRMETPLNFVCTCDIIGGNSGSPVVNRAGELVGLVFDGNIESLPGRFVFDMTANRTVSVHAGGMIHALRVLYDAGPLADEIEGIAAGAR